MRILIVTTQVPFILGGAEAQAEELRNALRNEGHVAEIVAIPFKSYPPEKVLDQMLACRLLDLNESSGVAADLVIGLKFPAYLIPHHNKVLWIIHQHRSAYDLWNHPLNDLRFWPNGASVRDVIVHADQRFIREARVVFAESRNVAQRLKEFCGIDSTPLYHPPPHAGLYYCANAEKYLLFLGRLTAIKRQSLALEALALTGQPVRVRFAGVADDPAYVDELKDIARTFKVDGRVEWLGRVTEQEKLDLCAHTLGILNCPLDEDYGYTTLEAMLASKPVITCSDSGGPLEFVDHGETGLIADPTAAGLAEAMDRLWATPELAARLGEAGRKKYDQLKITWPKVVQKLLS